MKDCRSATVTGQGRSLAAVAQLCLDYPCAEGHASATEAAAERFLENARDGLFPGGRQAHQQGLAQHLWSRDGERLRARDRWKPGQERKPGAHAMRCRWSRPP
jgi:hypothetical protein